MHKIEIHLINGRTVSFYGKYRRDLQTEHWHYYEDADGDIHHFRKEHMAMVSDIKLDRIGGETMLRLLKNKNTGQIMWSRTIPSDDWQLIQTMHEDDLPTMKKEEYEAWLKQSAVVDGVRMGPKV